MIIVSESGVTTEVDVPSPAQIEASYLVTLIGTDGTVWNLNEGPVTLKAGVKLFDGPPVTQWLKRSPGIAGARRTGMQVEEQNLLLPVQVGGGDAWDDYRDLEQRFFAGLDPDLPVTITVTSPNAVVKSINGWLTGVGDEADSIDPLLAGYRFYQLGFVAPDAYWQGPVIPRKVSFEAPVPFLDPPGPPFYLNPPNNSQNATIDNPGDVPAWARLTLHGPAATFTISIGDALYVSTKPVVANSLVIIDAATRSILNGSGTRIFENLDQVINKPIPRGEDIPIGIDVTGFDPDQTRLDVELAPLYRRPL